MLAAVATAVMAYRVAGLDRRIAHALAIAAAGTVAQVPLGAVTVEFDLNPYLVMSHFLLAMAVVSVSTWATLRALRPGRAPAAPAERRLGLLAWAAVAAYLALITSGAFVTAAGPHPGSTSTPIERLGNFYDAAWRARPRRHGLHRPLRRRRPSGCGGDAGGRGAQRLSIVGVVLLGCQAAVGEYQYRNGLPWAVIAVHVALAATLLITVVVVASLVWEGDRAAQAAVGPGERAPPSDGAQSRRRISCWRATTLAPRLASARAQAPSPSACCDQVHGARPPPPRAGRRPPPRRRPPPPAARPPSRRRCGGRLPPRSLPTARRRARDRRAAPRSRSRWHRHAATARARRGGRRSRPGRCAPSTGRERRRPLRPPAERPHVQVADGREAELRGRARSPRAFLSTTSSPTVLHPRCDGGLEGGGHDAPAEAAAPVRRRRRHAADPGGGPAHADQGERRGRVPGRSPRASREVDIVHADVLAQRGLVELQRHQIVREARVEELGERGRREGVGEERAHGVGGGRSASTRSRSARSNTHTSA